MICSIKCKKLFGTAVSICDIRARRRKLISTCLYCDYQQYQVPKITEYLVVGSGCNNTSVLIVIRFVCTSFRITIIEPTKALLILLIIVRESGMFLFCSNIIYIYMSFVNRHTPGTQFYALFHTLHEYLRGH